MTALTALKPTFTPILWIGDPSIILYFEAVFDLQSECGEGVESSGVVAGELFDEAVILLLEAEKTGGLVESGVDTVEVEAGDLFFNGALHGVVDDGVDGREREILVGAAADEIDGFVRGVDEKAGADGGFVFEIFDDVELALGFFNDICAVFDIFGVFDGVLEELAGFGRIEVDEQPVGVALESGE